MKIRILFAAALAATHFGTAAGAVPFMLDQVINTTGSETFGSGFELEGSSLYVQVKRSRLTGARSFGLVQRFDTETGNRGLRIAGPNSSPGDNFGFSLDAGGDRLLVGALGRDRQAAYLYDIGDPRVPLMTFQLDSATEQFGSDVALNGDTVLIADPSAREGGQRAGAVYQFDAASGALLRTFTDPVPDDAFGYGGSIDLDAGKALIGYSSNENAAGEFDGEAYLYDLLTGDLLQTFNDPTPTTLPPEYPADFPEFDDAGFRVALDGDRALMSRNQIDIAFGNVTLWDVTTGTLLQNFVDPTPTLSDGFGFSIDLQGDLVLIGEPLDDSSGIRQAGAAHLFDAVTGRLLQSFTPPNPQLDGRFGRAVAIDGTTIAINTSREERAYIYTPTPIPLPSSLPLMLGALGVGGLLLRGRSRRRW